MKVLFQGGWKAGRDPDQLRETIAEYCVCLASHIVNNNHAVVLTSTREFDALIAEEVVRVSQKLGRNVKDHLIYLLPEREATVPAHGRVVQIPKRQWWVEERTEAVLYADALIVVGGGRGSLDCVEKAFLSNKPAFVAMAVSSAATTAWRSRVDKYKFRNVSDEDMEALNDLNLRPEEFFTHVFSVIKKIADAVHSRRIFIVHGHDLYARDSLVDVLRRLKFEPIVLSEQPRVSLTIIESLERNAADVGFAFVIYTPDDVGRAKAGGDKQRARQNVVFEHGLLIGLLGRSRTCALVLGELEEPSDIGGMLHESIVDVRNEALKIARVLKDAGYAVDISGLM